MVEIDGTNTPKEDLMGLCQEGYETFWSILYRLRTNRERESRRQLAKSDLHGIWPLKWCLYVHYCNFIDVAT